MLSITERIKRYEEMGYTNDEAYDKVLEEEWYNQNDIIERGDDFEIDYKLILG